LAAALATLLALSSGAASVTFEAESGVLGTNWAVSNGSGANYITITTGSTGTNPGSADRVASYVVAFPAAGTYQLYARVQVGPGGYNSDSLFYAGSFGMKSPTNNGDWVLVNGLAGAGFSNSTDVVTGGGALGSGMWKWINLSQFTGQGGFSVSAGNLTQTFQIGAREAGLELDKFVFGTAGYAFTVSNLDHGTDGAPPTATIDPTRTYQTIEGFGGATAFYAGWVTVHPYKLEIYTNAFAGLNLSMLRLGDWYRYQTPLAGFDSAATEIVANANRVLGHPVPVYMSSWSPPAFLKSNGQVGNGGTLIYTNGSFDYTGFAQYWYDSIQAYQSNGVNLTWASIQNEPDWVAGYDSCIFHPTEDTVNGTNYASYSKALDAVYQRLTNLPSPPKLLAPEPTHSAYNDLQNYAATMNSGSFYGIAYHLYGGSTDGTPDGYTGDLTASAGVFSGKPHFMTEFGYPDMMQTACLIHDCLTTGQDSGFNYWSLIWPVGGDGLVQIENPYDRSTWTNAPPGVTTQSHGWWLTPSYWAMKHFSYFLNPGYRRVSASDSDSNVRCSAYLSPDGLRLVVVLINTSAAASSAMNFNFGAFDAGNSSVYQTAGTNTYAGTNTFLALGALTNGQALPPLSLTTVVLDESVSTNRPPLTVSSSTTNLTLSWPLASAGFTVQSRTNLVLGSWENLTSPAPQTIGGQWQVTLPVAAGAPATFYRLSK
jgi:O-glycosyl hydrolase